jgi:hypothetical protein
MIVKDSENVRAVQSLSSLLNAGLARDKINRILRLLRLGVDPAALSEAILFLSKVAKETEAEGEKREGMYSN